MARVCVVYDCLYPWTVGGAERWLRDLSERLAASGHEVTFVTRRQWGDDEIPDISDVKVVAVSPAEPLYDSSGKRTIGPPLRFGRGVLGHLLRRRGFYDVVHTCSFPYFSVLAARAAVIGTRTRLSVDWFEVWSEAYWFEYLGPIKGRIASVVQCATAKASPRATVFSSLHGQRLTRIGTPNPVVRLSGLLGDSGAPRPDFETREPLVVFAGRHIPEKRPDLLPAAMSATRRTVSNARAEIYGDGPRHSAVLAEIRRLSAEEYVVAPGFVDAVVVRDALSRAACHVLPSSREGYGLVVLEAAASGTPSVVIAGVDNAATELVIEGVNGAVAESPAELSAAITRVLVQGPGLRATTRAWYQANAESLTASRSAEEVDAWIREQQAQPTSRR